MASEPPPGNPRPDSSPPPAGSHARPASLPPTSEWLTSPDDTPADQLPDDVLFDELIAEAEPIDSSPADGLIDLNQLETDMSNASGATYISDTAMDDPGEEPETIFPPQAAAAPPPEPVDDWLASPSALEVNTPLPPDLGPPTSDVILGQHRDTSEDALGGDGLRNASSSSIFEAPPQGSSRFDSPTDPTEPVPDFAGMAAPPPSDLLVDIEETGSSGHLFGEGPNLLDDPQTDIGAAPSQDSSSSGIMNSDSSIFGNVPSPESNLAAADLLAGTEEDLELDEDIHATETSTPSSHIFMPEHDGGADDANVSFALPQPEDAAASGPTSGLIDWSTPGSGPKLTDHLTAEEAEAAGVPDLAELARQIDTPRPAATPAPRRSQPAQPAAAPPPPAAKTSGLVSWLGGTAVGLLIGIGLSAGAYFTGLVPNSEAKQIAEEDALRRRLAEATQQIEDAKTQAATAKADGDKAASDLVATQRALVTAQRNADAMTTARDRASQDLTAEKKKLTESQKLLTAAQSETRTAVEKVREDGKTAVAEQMKLLAAAMKDLDTKTTLLTAAETKATDALAKQKAADESLAKVVKELKVVKLIDEKDDAAAALAKLPDVLKKASAAAASADVQKAAAALLASKQETEAARAEVKTAEATVAKVREEAKTAVEAANKKAAGLFEVIQQKDIELADVRTKAERDLAAKLAAKEDEHRQQLASARAGVIVPLSSGEVVAKERATEAFNQGVEAYFAGRYTVAEPMLLKATQLDGTDARSWYFLGLTRFQLGKPSEEAFKKGGELEARNQPSAKAVTNSLERVQGAARQALNAHRP